jgi:hypothetical protein
VFFDGEQRAGTLHGVDPDFAAQWEGHGWVTVITEAEAEPPSD